MPLLAHCRRLQVPELLKVVLTETHDRRDYSHALRPLLIECSRRLADLSRVNAEVFAVAVADLSKLAAHLAFKDGQDEGSMPIARQTSASASSEHTKQKKKQKTPHKRSEVPADAEPVAAYFRELAACVEVPAAMQTLFTLLAVTACSGDCTAADAAAVSKLASAAVLSAQMGEPAAKAIGDGFAALGVACKCRTSALGSLLSTAMRTAPELALRRNMFEDVSYQIPAQAGKQRPRAWFARIALPRRSDPYDRDHVDFAGLPAGVSVDISRARYNSQFTVNLRNAQAGAAHCCVWPATSGRVAIRQRLLQAPCHRWKEELQLAGITDALVLECAPTHSNNANFSPKDFDYDYDYHVLLEVVA